MKIDIGSEHCLVAIMAAIDSTQEALEISMKSVGTRLLPPCFLAKNLYDVIGTRLPPVDADSSHDTTTLSSKLLVLTFNGLVGTVLAIMVSTGEYSLHPCTFLTLYLTRYETPLVKPLAVTSKLV